MRVLEMRNIGAKEGKRRREKKEMCEYQGKDSLRVG
jgi:hypothetical protein